MKKSVTKTYFADKNPYEGSTEELKIMSELWDKDKLKNKEKIAELNLKIGEFDK